VKRHLLRFGLVLSLLLSACGGAPQAGEGTTSTAGGESTLPQPVSSTGESAITSTTAPVVTSTTSGRPVAPDFTLELGEGGSFTLSEGEKPVYLVFWAEW
jgi:hypothetical protein